jgi:pyridoxamine 5'-phosphate oxidase family protein
MADPFTAAEREFLRGQRCGRLVNVDPGSGPHVSLVLYQMHGDELVLGGVDLRLAPAWADVRRRGRAVLVVDELASGPEPVARGVRLDGPATADDSRARPIVRLRPEHIHSWGL